MRPVKGLSPTCPDTTLPVKGLTNCPPICALPSAEKARSRTAASGPNRLWLCVMVAFLLDGSEGGPGGVPPGSLDHGRLDGRLADVLEVGRPAQLELRADLGFRVDGVVIDQVRLVIGDDHVHAVGGHDAVAGVGP